MYKLPFLLSFLASTFLVAQVPSYYGNINLSEINELKSQLSELIIETHTNFIPYTASDTDVWDVLRISDLVNADSDNVLLLYGYDDSDSSTNNDRTRDIYSNQSSNCIGYWNREHVFAKSLANPSLVTNEPGPGTDVHNLRAADCQMNSNRNNRFFIGGSGNSGTLGSYFYPGDEFKGDVARIIMYMYLRYPSQCEPSSIGVGGSSYSLNDDMPDIFLEWNQQDPVSEFERNRNAVIYSYQGNRNPFIDNPYIATLIWGGPSAEETWGVLSKDSYYKNLYVYPTICKDEIYITNHTSDIRLEYSIFNIDGNEVQKGNAHNSIMLKNHPTGTYFLTIGYGDNKKSQTIYIL